MKFFETTRFRGTLSGHGSIVPLGFDLMIDDLGILHLALDHIPFSREAYALHVNGLPGTSVDLIALEGRSEEGHVFRSESFFISQFSHRSEVGQELSYQGNCDSAELEIPASSADKPRRDARVWLVRQLRTFGRVVHDTPLGRVVIGGPQQDREAQMPNGFIAVHRPDDIGEDWWEQSERLLIHLARVLSFACDTYLLPVIEERFHQSGVTIRITRRGRASAPFMAPYHELHMDPIFACACESYFKRREAVDELDAAIRWLTAPVAYDESRLINAMSALENILDQCGLEEVDRFMSPSAFKRVASRVRSLLKELSVPPGMAEKVPELNRRTLSEKVVALLRARGIAVADLPENWLAKVIRQRNTIVHTGLSGDDDEMEADTLDYTIWVREVVTRIILNRLGFTGAFRSWLHHDEQYYFPDCIPMTEWVARCGSTPLAGGLP